MAFRRKVVETREVDATIWKCTNLNCLGWMRVELSFAMEPDCHLCSSHMVKENKRVIELNQKFLY